MRLYNRLHLFIMKIKVTGHIIYLNVTGKIKYDPQFVWSFFTTDDTLIY